MKCVYVLTSTEKDYYFEETFISMISLKKYNPNAEIILLTDDKTDKTLVGFREQIKEIASEVIVQNFSEYISQKVRSRLLKTSMRNLVDGRFFFIDSDTVIADRLNEEELANIDIGMVLDKHIEISKHYMYMYMYMYMNAKKMSYSVGYCNQHFNSGVIYVNDTKTAYDFFALWHCLYLETIKKGIEIDQTSLNEANYRMNGVITKLEGEWNVQINCGLKYLSNAKVIHYLGYQPMNKQNKYFNTLPFILCDAYYFNEIRKNRGITKTVGEIIDAPKKAFKVVTIIPEDCVAYKLLFSNHMRVLKFIYVKLSSIYTVVEKILGFIFLKIYKRV